jgi:ubiquinone/menaquinone biosynthesis C-methylase UbiE
VNRVSDEPETSAIGGLQAPTSGGSCLVPVAEGYELWAAAYDNAPNPLLACEERHLMPFLVGMQNKRILDLACGTGRWLHRLTAQGGNSGVGVDSSAAMLRVAAEKGAITGRLARAECESLPFGTAVFDLALCSFAVGHIQNLGSTVLELARVTTLGADVFVSDLHPAAYARGWRVGFRDHGTAIQIEMRPRATKELIEAFCSGGFECLEQKSLLLGEPEEPIFVRAGKTQSFATACNVPAILVCHFKRLDSPID